MGGGPAQGRVALFPGAVREAMGHEARRRAAQRAIRAKGEADTAVTPTARGTKAEVAVGREALDKLIGECLRLVDILHDSPLNDQQRAGVDALRKSLRVLRGVSDAIFAGAQDRAPEAREV